MNKGFLSQYFNGVAIKTLSSVEADLIISHQHEFNGIKELKNILGEPHDKVKFKTQFMYLSDTNNEPLIETGFLTWYDAREKARLERNVMRYEYRLYFSSSKVIEASKTDDVLIIAKKTDGTLLAILAENNSTIANQLIWLFGITLSKNSKFSIRETLDTEKDRIKFTSRLILENIGIDVQEIEDSYTDKLISKFGLTFPTTKVFSEYARSTLKNINPLDDPDNALINYMIQEEILFKNMEKNIIKDRLKEGFDDDVESFIKFSLTVQNRRKSRAGLGFENHIEYIFSQIGVNFDRTPVTENKSKPDFLFPGIKEYNSREFNPLNLTMLGVKSTCKDRWRQVLAEADRIENKHLLTLEAAISVNQTDEMQSKSLQLVIPQEIQSSYTKKQQSWLISFSDFIKLVQKRNNCV